MQAKTDTVWNYGDAIFHDVSSMRSMISRRYTTDSDALSENEIRELRSMISLSIGELIWSATELTEILIERRD